MRHKPSRRRQRRLAELARWLEEMWWCACQYHNVSALRCFGCGRRPPRSVCARVAAKPPVEVEVDRPAPVVVDA